MGADIKADKGVLVRVMPPELVAHRDAASNALEVAFLAFLQSKAAPSTAVPLERRLFLNVDEAAEFSGLPAVFLRRLIKADKLKALKTGSGWRIPRAELERLAGTLAAAAEGPRQFTEHELRDMELNRLRRKGIIDDPENIPMLPTDPEIV
ncbi:MAG: helix-turn-helix domain-containing protein [Bryobacteraceae bacterium]|jgi:excisionase family DNA binding protein